LECEPGSYRPPEGGRHTDVFDLSVAPGTGLARPARDDVGKSPARLFAGIAGSPSPAEGTAQRPRIILKTLTDAACLRRLRPSWYKRDFEICRQPPFEIPLPMAEQARTRRQTADLETEFANGNRRDLYLRLSKKKFRNIEKSASPARFSAVFAHFAQARTRIPRNDGGQTAAG
jgi:hypothetical protein